MTSEQKKEAARQDPLNVKKAEEETANHATNGATNVTVNGTGKRINGNPSSGYQTLTYEEKLVQRLENELKLAVEARSCIGTMAIHPRSRGIEIDDVSFTFHDAEILTDTNVGLNCFRRSSLMAPNGNGKSTLLVTLGNKELPVQDSESALEAVLNYGNDEIDKVYEKILDILRDNVADLDGVTQPMIVQVEQLKSDYRKQVEQLMAESVAIEMESIKLTLGKFVNTYRKSIEKPSDIENQLEIPFIFGEIQEKLNNLTKVKEENMDFQEQLSIKKHFVLP